ncbi:MAG: hypothetical protein HY329_21200 [Chloroflexi bacterium]|nr:hypothetical protein [Chloroflexota bacterium]
MTEQAELRISARSSPTARARAQWRGNWLSLVTKLTIGRVLIVTLIAAAFAVATREVVETDMGWHLKTGQLIVETGHVPQNDLYSFSARGERWIPHEWLTEVIAYLLYRAGGFGAIALAFAVVMIGPIPFVLRLLARRGVTGPGAVMLTALGVTCASALWGARAHVISVLFATIFYFVLERWWARPSRLVYFLPAMMVLWVNLHGGFPIGNLLIGLYLAAAVAERLGLVVGDRRRPLRQLVIALALSMVAGGVSPHGFAALVLPFEVLTSSIQRTYVVDWFSPNFHEMRFLPLLVLLLLPVILVGIGSYRLALTDALILVVFAALSLQSNRHSTYYAFLCLPAIGAAGCAATAALRQAPLWQWLAARQSQTTQREVGGLVPVALNWLLILIVLVVLTPRIASVMSSAANAEAQARFFPVAAVSYLRSQGFDGRLFNAHGWGGYLIWIGYPSNGVFFDSRGDLYDAVGLSPDYLRVHFGRSGWQEVLDRFAIDAVLMPPSTGAAAVLSVARSEWRQVYADDVAVIFVRQRSP